MSVTITKYDAICNLGCNIDEIFESAIDGVSDKFSEMKLNEKIFRLGQVSCKLPEIKDEDFNTRTNRLGLAVLNSLNIQDFIKKYGKENIAVVAATTNTGVEEYETSRNLKHAEISNLGEFVKNFYGLKNYCATVSTACSSGIKTFKIAEELLNTNLAKCVIVIGADGITKVPLYGFGSLEILSDKPSLPFSKNRCGINIGEGAAAFIVEKDTEGIEIAGIGETTDTYHSTTPNPEGKEAEDAIRIALTNAKLNPENIDYINLHGTGTISNDISEGKAVHNIFGNKVPASSTKPLTGHCLGAAASIEIALCCKLIEKNSKKAYPHIYDGMYDENIPKINLANSETKFEGIKTCLTTSFGFGGTDCAMIIKK